MSRRDDILDAALVILAAKGGRGLTHRGVDEKSGIPQGTTSNYFRTRHALMVGVTDHLLRRQREAHADCQLTHRPTTEDELLRAFAAHLDARIADPTTTIVHTTLLYEALVHDDLRDSAYSEYDLWRSMFADWLAPFGVDDPERSAHMVHCYCCSLVFGQHLQPTPGFDAVEALRPLIYGLLH